MKNEVENLENTVKAEDLANAQVLTDAEINAKENLKLDNSKKEVKSEKVRYENADSIYE